MRQQHFQLPFTIEIDGVTMEAKNSVRYLGLEIYHKLTYGEQIRKALNKAVSVTTALTRLMSNVTGPREGK